MYANFFSLIFLYSFASAEQMVNLCPDIIHVRRLMEIWSVQDCVANELSKIVDSLNNSCVKFNSTCASGQDSSASQCSEIMQVNWLMETWPVWDCISGELRKIFDIISKRCKATSSTCGKKPRDCHDILNNGHNATGEYTIYPSPDQASIQVRCDMDTTPGGWIVFQRRVSNSDFYKTWKEYEDGFGDLNGNFWLGNKYIHEITSQGHYQLRVDLTDLSNEQRYAEYKVFSIGDATSLYILYVDGYSGTANDGMSYHNGSKFSTKDRDNDLRTNSCAQLNGGAWWYTNCYKANLNGIYGDTNGRGPAWLPWTVSAAPMKSTEMKMRRV